MALRGNLKDFSLPDVFQLVTFSRKTGVLRIVRADGAEGSVWFRDGEVFFAASNWHTEPLGERLVKAQRITRQALKRVVDIRASEPEDGRRIGQILIDEGYITDTVLESFVSDQIQDTIFDLMRWDDGEFDFEAMPEVVEEDIGLTVSIENVVMEGSRRLEEWTRIKKKIPSTDVVFKMATAPGEGTFEIALKPTEWQLLLLIDGSRTVAELATVTKRTDFEVARVIYGLFSAGLLEFATDTEIEHNRAERIEREAKLAEIVAVKRAAEEAAQAEAQAREALLAAESKARREAEAVAAAKAARTEPEEEPEFLGGQVSAATADDQAALEEFIGAVLEHPAAQRAPEPTVPKVPSAPHIPAEEPAFMGVEHLEDSDLGLVPIPSVEDLFPEMAEVPPPLVVPVVPFVEPPAPEFLTMESAQGAGDLPEPLGAEELASLTAIEATLTDDAPTILADLDIPAAPESPEVTVHPAPAEKVDFERDLLALGLGELPSDLLEPLGAASEHAEDEIPSPAVFVEPSLEPEREPEPDPIDELVSAADPMSEVLPIDLIELAQQPLASEPALTEPLLVEPDFSALLESLDVDAPAVEFAVELETEPPLEPTSQPEPELISPADAGFDVELLREVEAVEAGGGVISTDAYLEDISIDDLGFSGGMTDELSALTGAERRGPVRPQASVHQIPDEGSNVLHRDARVDKDTVLKIIDGIKKL